MTQAWTGQETRTLPKPNSWSLAYRFCFQISVYRDQRRTDFLSSAKQLTDWLTCELTVSLTVLYKDYFTSNISCYRLFANCLTTLKTHTVTEWFNIGLPHGLVGKLLDAHLGNTWREHVYSWFWAYKPPNVPYSLEFKGLAEFGCIAWCNLKDPWEWVRVSAVGKL